MTRAERLLGGAEKLPRARAKVVKDANGMNKTEAAYAEVLELGRLGGQIAAWWFEPFNLRLAPNTYYRIDFLVQRPDGTLEIHEVKGFWQDDAKVKLRLAASMYPFDFFVVKMPRKGEIRVLPWKEGMA